MAAAPSVAGNGLSSSRGLPRSRGLDEGVIKVAASRGRAKGARAACNTDAVGWRQRRGSAQGVLDAGRSEAAASAGAEAASAPTEAAGKALMKASTLPPNLA